MKKLFFLITSLLSSLLFAENCCCPECSSDCSCPECPSDYCDTKPAPCCDFLAPCLNCQQKATHPRGGFNFQFIFSQPSLEGLEYAINNADANGCNGSVSNIDFDWYIGARGGIEYLYNYDTWNLSLYATILNSKAKDMQFREVVNQTNFNEPFNNIGIIPSWNHPSSYDSHMKQIRFSEAKAKWKEHFYLLNLMLGKKFCISNKITFLPSFGLSSLFIFEDYKVDYNIGKIFPIAADTLFTPNYSTSKNFQDTFGIGPRVGVDTRWYFCPNVNFFAGAFGSLLYTYFYTDRHDRNSFTIQDQSESIDDLRMKHNFTSVKPNIELLIGITYEHCIAYECKVPTFIRFTFGYGMQYYFKKNMYVRFVDDVNDGSFVPIQGDLHMQEVNIGVTCLF